MNAIESRGIKFYNKIINGKIRKEAVSSINDPDINFVTQFKDPETLNSILLKVEKALNGQFNLIGDPDVSTNLDIGFITPNGVDFYDQNGENVIGTLALQDFKAIITAWRDFLLQAPKNGTKV